jgi:DNA-binding NtrC family response regulator
VTAAARILVVDDDRSIRRTLEKFLGGEGHQVATAQDAAEAIAATDAADLMLLDLGLPGGSGFDVLTALAARPQRPIVVVITARDDMQSTVKAIQLGAYEYLVKPIDIDRLRAVIRQALDSRETRDQLEAFVTRSAEARMGGDILGRSPAIRDVRPDPRLRQAGQADVRADRRRRADRDLRPQRDAGAVRARRLGADRAGAAGA